MKRFFQTLHKALGLVAGLFISILCLTGAIMIFQDDVREAIFPERYFRPSSDNRSPLPITTIISKVNTEVGEDKIASIEISADTTRNYILAPEGKGKPKYFVDPYSGDIKGVMNPKDSDFFGYALKLHRWLLTSPDSWGKKVTGAATLLFVFILISGIIYWWPKGVKQLKARLQVKTNANSHRLTVDLHASLGIYASIVLLLMALTGLTWSYPWYRSGLYAILGIESPKESAKPEGKKDKGEKKQEHQTNEEVTPFDWDNAYAQVAARHDKYRNIRIEIGKASVARANNFGNPRAADSYKLDKQTGEIKSFEAYESQPEASRARGWIYGLHTGLWGGIITRILYFVVCILGASFPITGYIIYAKKAAIKRKKVTSTQP